MGIDGDRWWLFNRKKLTHNEGRTGGDLVVFWVCFMKREKKKKKEKSLMAGRGMWLWGEREWGKIKGENKK